VLRFVEVLQPVRAEVPERQPIGKLVHRQRTGRFRHEHLTTVPNRGDPGGPVDVQPDVLAGAQPSLAGVHPHPNPDRAIGRPLVIGQPALCVRGCRDGVDRRRENGEEAVALSIDVDAAVASDGRSKDVVVLIQDIRPSIAQRSGQVRGCLDVGDQERDGAGGQTYPVQCRGHGLGPRSGCPSDYTPALESDSRIRAMVNGAANDADFRERIAARCGS
jgi:hypothetical protein